MKPSAVSRRRFLATTAAAWATIQVVPGRVLGAGGEAPPSRRINVAGIGVGGMGKNNIAELAKTENIVALCDVDHAYCAPVFAKHPGAELFKDYRVMLEKRKDIEAVMIATPDHTHAVIAMAALKAGKHVYCQKPLTRHVGEARMLAKAAAESKLVTQMGIQGHSGEGIRLITEWIRSGAIGAVREVDAWCTLSYYPAGRAYWCTTHYDRPAETPPTPEGMDWDLWIGPAPMRPYHPTYHPGRWRAWKTFGSGMIADRGTHTLDPIVAALELGAPESVTATVCGGNAETHPFATIVNFRFPARGAMPSVKLNWYDGLRAPRPPELEDGRILGEPEGGALFRGDKGLLTCGIYGGSPRLIPETAMKDFKRPEPTLPRVKGSHERDWTDAIREGRKAGADFAYGGPLTEILQLGNIAMNFDGILKWDAAAQKFPNRPEADAMVMPRYRDGWTLG